MSTSALDREAALERFRSEQFDVVVVGGGITGCGVALESAARGLRTALVEARDLASGTSSKSSKLVHGGLRYLQQHDYLLVYEALAERQRLLRNAPHLVHPLPFLIPLFGKEGVVSASVAKAYSGALWLYDVTGGLRIGRRHRRIPAEEALAHFPVLRSEQLVASFLYWDAQADDARLTLSLALTAAELGAAVANYCPVAGLLESAGKVRGVALADGTEIRSRVVINAGGVWSAEVERLPVGERSLPAGISIRPAKGIHITVPAALLPCDYASVLSVPGDKRSVFVVPWAADEATGPDGPGRFTYVGTTDTDYQGSLDDPQCTPEDVEYVLSAVNAWTSANLSPDDVTGTWAGLRPLISDASSARTADLSRRHKVKVSPAGLVTITGGKLTTYRKMGADALETALEVMGERPSKGLARRALGRVRSSPTARLALAGSEPYDRPAQEGLAQALGIDARTLAHLRGRFGARTTKVLELVKADPSLARPAVAGLAYLMAEVVWATRSEMAQSVSDVLSRRTRALILHREAAAAAAPEVAAVMASELGWDDARTQAELDAFMAEVEAERQALGRPSGRSGQPTSIR